MSTMSNDVERLDFGKAPRGYGPVDAKSFEDGTFYTCAAPTHPGWRGELRAEVLAVAWAHYKARNNPPVMEVFVWPKEKASDPPTAWCVALLGKPHFMSFGPDAEDEARAAAWAWYERRLALAERIGHGEFLLNPLDPGFDPLWPRILSLTDEQVAKAERSLVDDSLGVLPEVLRG